MSIDWVTVIAQIANFLLLVWLLKKFLYQPILKGIEAREADIRQRIQAADEAKKEANILAETLRAKLEAHELQHETLLNEALAATEHEREALLKDARERIQQEQQALHASLKAERQAFVKRLEQQATDSLLAVSQKVIQELADETLENAIARQLVRKLPVIMPDLQVSSVGQSAGQVSSRWPLTSDTQQQLLDQMRKQIPEVSLRFHHGDEYPMGISLQLGGAQLTWTLDSYLSELRAQLDTRQSGEPSNDGVV